MLTCISFPASVVESSLYCRLSIRQSHKGKNGTIHKHLNEQNDHIQFTKENKDNGKLPFLDCLVSHDYNQLWYEWKRTGNRCVPTDHSFAFVTLLKM